MLRVISFALPFLIDLLSLVFISMTCYALLGCELFHHIVTGNNYY